MRITDVQTILLTGPCTLDPFLSEARERRSAAFIRILTDGPHHGLGETYIGYFFPEVVSTIVDFFKPILVGRNVDDIPTLWGQMYHSGNFWCRVGLGISVINGIEAALWDLKGKLENKPVYELLGGPKHKKMLAYATGGPSNYPLDKLAEKVEFYASLGFLGLKIGAGAYYKDKGFEISGEPAKAADTEAQKLAFVRQRFGKDLRVMLDGHMGNSPKATWSVETALAVVKAVAPFNLTFFEEPLHYTDPWGYAQLCREKLVPIAGGECLTGTYEWRVFAEQNSFDIAQPDAAFTGGLGTFMEVAEMFAKRGKLVATHAWGAGGALMQNVHVAFATPNMLIHEVPPAYGPLHSEIVDGAFVMKDGYIMPPDRPGLGIRLTDDIIRRFPFQPGSGEYNSVPGKILPEEVDK